MVRPGLTIVCVGTGPSLKTLQVEAARRRGFPLFGCNLTFRDIPDLALVHACNFQLWDVVAEKHLDEILARPARKTTTRPESAAKYPWLELWNEVDKPGLSETPRLLHHGHSSGFQLLGLAKHAGATRVVLIGYDLRFPRGYNGAAREAGGKRHYFGEYSDPRLQHWPKAPTSIDSEGRMIGLLPYYTSAAEQIEIVNCSSPDSALTPYFGFVDIERL